MQRNYNSSDRRFSVMPGNGTQEQQEDDPDGIRAATSLSVNRANEAHAIAASASDRLDRGPEYFLRAPWRAMHELIGPVSNGSFVVLSGRSGHGKTSLMMSWFDRCVDDGYKAMYAGTEIPARDLMIHWACRRLANRGIFVHPGDALKGKLHRDSPERIPEWEFKADALRTEITVVRNMHDFGRIVPVPHLTAEIVTRIARQAYAWGIRVIFLDHLDHILTDGTGGSDVTEHTAILTAIHAATRKYDITIIGAAQLKSNAHPDPIRKYRPLTDDMVLYGMIKRRISDMMICTFRPLPPPPSEADKLIKYRKAINLLRTDETGIENFLIPHTVGVGFMKDRDYGKDGTYCFLGIQGGRISDANSLNQLQAEHALLTLAS